MSLQAVLKTHLDQTGESMRSVSLRAGLNAKAISDIMNLSGIRPRHSTLSKLSAATGLDLVSLVDFSSQSYAELVRHLKSSAAGAVDPTAMNRQMTRINWLMRAAEWLPTRTVCRGEILEFFARVTPAEAGLSPGSLATYKSEILNTIGKPGVRSRKRGIKDIGGIWAELYDEIWNSDLKLDLKYCAGPFLVFLHDAGVMPNEATEATLTDYYVHRLNSGVKDEKTCRKHVKRVAHLVSKCAEDPQFVRFALHPVEHPFPDGSDKFGVPDTAVASLLREWDSRITPWAMGLASRDGQSRAAFIATLDELEEEVSDKKLRLREKRTRRASGRGRERSAGKSARDELLLRYGFLTKMFRWSENTARVRRGYVVALAKAFYAATGEAIESVDELTDPEILEDAVDALADANSGGEFDSGYIASILKAVHKVAAGYVCRGKPDLEAIADLISEFDCGAEGIAPRNKAKLRRFTPDRVQAMIDLTDILVNEVNRTVETRRKAHQKKHGKLPNRISVFDPELARDVMAALAHAIMMKRGPRSENLVGIRLDWIRWQNDLATIVIPAVEVKLRGPRDPDLPIPLGVAASRLLRSYVDHIRQVALVPGDAANPYLFPGQDHARLTRGRPYSRILQRVTRKVHKIVGVPINPHLYRHLIGWIWLRDNLDNLPKVQRLLGHKSLQTTLNHYAEIDDDLALDEWQQRLDQAETDLPSAPTRRARPARKKGHPG